MSNLSMNHYSSPPRISVVINTYNAEKHLEKVLDSVKQFDEIVLCDMYSTDKTLEIARKI
jgi:glycosyltransferase involved in cell wall biosynthesis